MYLSRICVGRRLILVLHDEIVELVVRRLVQPVEHDGARRDVAAVMARPARHFLRAAELRLVDRGHHFHHPARGPLDPRVEHPIHRIRAGAGVAVRAVPAERAGHDAHRRDEIVDRQGLQRAGRDVLEKRAGDRPWRGRRYHGLCRRPDRVCETTAIHTLTMPAATNRHELFMLFSSVREPIAYRTAQAKWAPVVST